MFLRRTRVQRLSNRLWPVFPLVACLLVSAADAQEVMLHDGKSALVFRAAQDMTIAVDLTDHDGERALRFPVKHSHFGACSGYLYVSRNHVAYDPVFTPKFEKDALNFDRKDVKKAEVGIEGFTHDCVVAIWSARKQYLFYALFDSGSEKKFFGKESAGPAYQFIARSLNDFDSAWREAETLTASLGRQDVMREPTVQSDSSPKPAAQPSVKLQEGQTPQEVEELLGTPEDTITLQESLIYIYPTVKVIFEKNKLMDVQPRKP